MNRLSQSRCSRGRGLSANQALLIRGRPREGQVNIREPVIEGSAHEVKVLHFHGLMLLSYTAAPNGLNFQSEPWRSLFPAARDKAQVHFAQIETTVRRAWCFDLGRVSSVFRANHLLHKDYDRHIKPLDWRYRCLRRVCLHRTQKIHAVTVSEQAR